MPGTLLMPLMRNSAAVAVSSMPAHRACMPQQELSHRVRGRGHLIECSPEDVQQHVRAVRRQLLALLQEGIHAVQHPVVRLGKHQRKIALRKQGTLIPALRNVSRGLAIESSARMEGW